MSDRRDVIIALADAKPTTVFEQIAEQILVEVTHHNGGLREVSLFELLKYPNAFCVTDHLRALNEPANAPSWDGNFVLGPF